MHSLQTLYNEGEITKPEYFLGLMLCARENIHTALAVDEKYQKAVEQFGAMIRGRSHEENEIVRQSPAYKRVVLRMKEIEYSIAAKELGKSSDELKAWLKDSPERVRDFMNCAFDTWNLPQSHIPALRNRKANYKLEKEETKRRLIEAHQKKLARRRELAAIRREVKKAEVAV